MLNVRDAGGRRGRLSGDNVMTHQSSVPWDAALHEASIALRHFHKTLLDFQARESGFQGAPMDLFDRATHDARYVWLRPLATLIVDIDTYRDEPDSNRQRPDGARFKRRIAALIDADQDQEAMLRSRINRALQTHPEVGSALGTVRKALNRLPDRP